MAIRAEPNPYESPTSSGIAGIPQPDAKGFRHFRVQFIPLWLLMTVTTSLALLLLHLLFSDGVPTVGFVELGICTVAFAIEGILVAILVYNFPIKISDEGVKCPNSWGKYDFVKWNDISEVRFVNLIGFRHVRIITSTSRRSIWFPYLW